MYLDPGFGSMVIQLVIGGAAAMGAGFFMFRQRIAEVFNSIFKKDVKTVASNEEQE